MSVLSDGCAGSEQVVELLEQLIAIPSVTPRDGEPSDEAPGEAKIARFVVAWLRERGVEAELSQVSAGRPNVVATVPGRSSRKLLLETHLDTVEVTGMEHPFTPVHANGRLVGRGSADAKASLAAYMLALAQLQQAPEPPPVTVTLAAVADEEHAYRGVLTFLESDSTPPTDYVGALVGEPTGLVPGVAHKGCVRFTIHVAGEGGHSSRPENAVNAIALMATIVEHLEADANAAAGHPLLGHGTRTVTRIAGGEGPNLVPGHCEIDIDRRTLPGEDPHRVAAEITAELEPLAPGRIRVDPPFTVDYALDTNPESELVTAISAVLRKHGRSDTPEGMPFGTDASKLARAGIPAVVLGPGDIGDAHTIDESVDLGEVAGAVDIVLGIVAQLGLSEETGVTT